MNDMTSTEPTAADIAAAANDAAEFAALRRAEVKAAAMAAAYVPDNAARRAAAARRDSIREQAQMVIGMDSVSAVVRELNVIRRRRRALVIINSHAHIDTVEAVETLVFGNDADKVTRASYPLARVDSAALVTVWPVRLTGHIRGLILGALDAVIGGADGPAVWASRVAVAPLPHVTLNAHTGAIVGSRLGSSPAVAVDTVARLTRVISAYGPKTVAWDGTDKGLMDLLTRYASHRVSAIADRAPVVPRMRRAHKANQATRKNQVDVAMALAVDKAMGKTDETDREELADMKPSQIFVAAAVMTIAHEAAREVVTDPKAVAVMVARWEKWGLSGDVIIALESWVSQAATPLIAAGRRRDAAKRLAAGKAWAPRGYAVQGTDVAGARLANSLRRSGRV